MPSLRDMFDNDFADGSIGQELSCTIEGSATPVQVLTKVMYNHDMRIKYVAIFVDPVDYSANLALSLAQYSPQLVEQVSSEVSITSSHPVFDPEGEGSGDLIYTGRLFLYVDQAVDFNEQATVAAAAKQAGVHLKFRDQRYKEFMNEGSKPLAFVSHDSRDKDSLVRPLVEKLGSMMCPVWYDEYALRPGDSLRESIDKGLSETAKCVLILSPNFLSNPGWTKGEFNAAMNKHFSSGGSVLIPVWHDVSRADVAKYSTLIADIVAVRSNVGIDDMARQLARVLKP